MSSRNNSKRNAPLSPFRAPEIWYAPDRNRRRFLVLSAAMLSIGAVLTVVNPTPLLSQGVAIVKVDVAVVGQGYRVSKLTGQNVINDKNEKIGTLDDLIIGKDKSMFGVVQVGGFLGIGSRLVAVPYDSLKIDDAGRRIELPGATKDSLKNLPEFKYLT